MNFVEKRGEEKTTSRFSKKRRGVGTIREKSLLLFTIFLTTITSQRIMSRKAKRPHPYKKKKKEPISETETELNEIVLGINTVCEMLNLESNLACKKTLLSIINVCETKDLALKMVKHFRDRIALSLIDVLAQKPNIPRVEYMVHGKDSREGICPLFLSGQYEGDDLKDLTVQLEQWKTRVKDRLEKNRNLTHVHFNCHGTGAGGFAPILLTTDTVLSDGAKVKIEDASKEVRTWFAEQLKREEKFEVQVFWHDEMKRETIARLVRHENFYHEDFRKELREGAIEMLDKLAKSRNSVVENLRSITEKEL